MWFRMKFTIRILSKEKRGLKTAGGVQACVMWPWETGEGREKVCTRIRAGKRGRGEELAVEGEELPAARGGCRMKSLAPVNRTGVEGGECRVLAVSGLALHPPGGHWNVLMDLRVLPRAVEVPQQPLVFLEDPFWGTDSIK